MGALLNIWEDLLEDTSFGLFAIHSQLEDYALAYALNQACGIKLRRLPDDLELDQQVYFPLFQYKDEANQREWTLARNSGISTGSGTAAGLFPDEPSHRKHFLIPEKKEVDFFLKLEGEDAEQNLVSSLLSISKIITAYRLEASKLKSKQNLIF
ncbi:IPExxxVDY family protein [Robiginitalea sp. SC105]|uniref:IPExxxVDY family protein n=1 Tax=Robiginitalea sp. SC105 TaxID=2762332 RepID=UPI00163A9357|nr:IPExxxVDY family protein [Robiginitalea sp. SC105]MBC2838061.1 IPExxxVDY family protein [Robiginitalea sp. SC105]